MATLTPSRAGDLLAVEVADAWFEYLAATRNEVSHRYEEVEPWAWTRLQARLRAVRARRRVLTGETAA